MGSNTVFLLSLVYLCNFNIPPVQSEECQTPENTSGQCMVIQNCPPLYSLAQKKPVPKDTAEYLRRAHCGFTGTQPNVCCPIMAKHPDTSDLLPSREVCGKQAEDRIFAGMKTTIRDYPWMALLEYQEPNYRQFRCGGFLINNRYVLTAAHCLLDLPPRMKLISVRLGEHNLNTTKDCENEDPGLEDCSNDPLDLTIEEQIPHELYIPHSLNRHHDIALLRLSQAVGFTTFITPLCLPLSQRLRNKDYYGQDLTVTGWGLTETRNQSDIKLKVDIPVISETDCALFYKEHGITLLSSQVCVGGVQKKDSCVGDSGGPLMIVDRTPENENYIAYAMVSFGPNRCGTDNFPAVYTRLKDYVDWIRDHLKP